MSEEKTNFFQTNREPIVFAALSALVLAVYWQATGFGFINLDDNLYVYENPYVLGGLNLETVKWSLTAFHSANWHPLTWLSLALDVQIFGRSAGGHHAANVVYHLINTLLAFAVFRQLTGGFWRSAAVAALFAVHPAHVESVAWIAERKDVLSTMFWFLAMWAYLRHVRKDEEKGRRGEEEKGRKGEEESERRGDEEISVEKNGGGSKNAKTEKETKDSFSSSHPLLVSPSPRLLLSSSYLLVVAFFVLGLMAKPMLVTLPCVLLLCDFWALERLKRLKDLPALVLEKLPLFALSAASSYITVLAQKSGGAVQSLDYLPLETRFVNSIVAYAKYVVMLFYPVKLAVWYPYENVFSVWQTIGAIALLAGVTIFCWLQKERRKYLLMGWLWFLGTLVPVIGLVQVGDQSMADRYTYVPYFGLFVMIVWGVCDLAGKNRKAFFALCGVAIAVFSILSFRQASLWRSNETLYRQALAVTEKNHLAAHNLCHALLMENRLDEAETFCRAAMDWKMNYSEVYNTLAIIQIRRGEYAAAEETLREVTRFAPGYNLTYINLSVALALQNRPAEAEENLEKAVRLGGRRVQPQIWLNSLNALVQAYADQKNYEKAAENIKRVLNLAPENADARAVLALTLYNLKRYDEALAEIEEAIRQNPNQAAFYNTKGLILLEANRATEAAGAFEKALELKPDLAEAKENLKKARERK